MLSKDVINMIAMNLKFASLLKFCKTCKRFNDCLDDGFWRRRLLQLKLKDVSKANFQDPREAYIEIEKYREDTVDTAILNNKIYAVKYFMDYTKNVRNLSKRLIEACCRSRINIMEYLIKKGADIHFKRDRPLKIASICGSLEAVKYLEELGVNIHVKKENALHLASKYGKLEVVKYLIEKGADVNAGDDKALISAVRKGHIEVVKYLLENGADIHAQEDELLMIASQNGYTEIVKYLVEKGFDIHINKDQVLSDASGIGNIEMIKIFLQKGADIHANDDRALQHASENGKIEAVKFLLERGANIHANGENSVELAFCRGQYKLVKYLLEQGAEITDKFVSFVRKFRSSEYKLIRYFKERTIDLSIEENLIDRELSIYEEDSLDGEESWTEETWSSYTDEDSQANKGSDDELSYEPRSSIVAENWSDDEISSIAASYEE